MTPSKINQTTPESHSSGLRFLNDRDQRNMTLQMVSNPQLKSQEFERRKLDTLQKEKQYMEHIIGKVKDYF